MMKALSTGKFFLFTVMTVVGAGSALGADSAKSLSFSVPAQAVAPGVVLAPGDYTLQIVNKLSDRVLLKIEGNGVDATFLGVENPTAFQRSAKGLVRWDNQADGVDHIRGWAFAGAEKPIEFVYPKDEAVKIAQANVASVPAVDPASEGKPIDNTISRADLQTLNLWVLHLDRVGDEGGGIKAQHFVNASAPKPKPVVAALPHTASLMPVAWIVGILSLLAACVLRITRRKYGASASA